MTENLETRLNNMLLDLEDNPQDVPDKLTYDAMVETSRLIARFVDANQHRPPNDVLYYLGVVLLDQAVTCFGAIYRIDDPGCRKTVTRLFNLLYDRSIDFAKKQQS